MSAAAICRYCAEEIPSDSAVCPECKAAEPCGPAGAGRRRLALKLGLAGGLLVLIAALVWLLPPLFAGLPARAQAAAKAGHWDKGAELCQRWASAQPGEALAWYYLASCRVGQRDGEAAAQALRRYLALAPGDAGAAQWLRRYERRALALRRKGHPQQP